MGVRETAKYLNMSVAWVYKNANEHGLVPYKFGVGRNAKIQFRVSEVEAWVVRQRASTSSLT
ncbi:helix-turn-helix domain-containing protein [Streptomyces sp. NPDC059011]|uniref:helix-turn-helix domain-containing protein n=1 Tax=unclassified Streptomyces TaxID=2593676 RepID=UPI0036C3218A